LFNSGEDRLNNMISIFYHMMSVWRCESNITRSNIRFG